MCSASDEIRLWNTDAYCRVDSWIKSNSEPWNDRCSAYPYATEYRTNRIQPTHKDYWRRKMCSAIEMIVISIALSIVSETTIDGIRRVLLWRLHTERWSVSRPPADDIKIKATLNRQAIDRAKWRKKEEAYVQQWTEIVNMLKGRKQGCQLWNH